MIGELDRGFPVFVRVHSPRKGILRCAILSRCLIIVISAVSNFIIPDHNASDVFIQPAEDEDHSLKDIFFDNLIKILLGGLARWDAQYFLHIAKHSYVFENSLAFFPLFPLLIRWLSLVWGYLLQNVLTESSILLLSATILNFAVFLKAADIFFSLSLYVLGDANLAYTSAVLFCFNPASIFFSAPYTETLFSLLTFSGIYHTFKNDQDVLGSVLFGLSAGTRSNGIINMGFILFKKIKHFFSVLWPVIIKPKLMVDPISCSKTIIFWSFSILGCCILIVVPFLSFQFYSYYMFCTPQDINLTVSLMNNVVDNGLVLPSLGGKTTRPRSHWCHSTLPLAYSYVQNHYWNVGFLRYFQLAQIPNFLLASPVVFLILTHGITFFQQHKKMCLTLGFLGKSVVKADKRFRMSANMFVFMVHSVALTLFCFFCIHVQVTTRMIFSASPIPYWVGAYIVHEGFIQRGSTKEYRGNDLSSSMSNYRRNIIFPEWRYINSINAFWDYKEFLKTHLTFKGKLLLLYFISYFVLGTVLFSNFLPWT